MRQAMLSPLLRRHSFGRGYRYRWQGSRPLVVKEYATVPNDGFAKKCMLFLNRNILTKIQALTVKWTFSGPQWTTEIRSYRFARARRATIHASAPGRTKPGFLSNIFLRKYVFTK